MFIRESTESYPSAIVCLMMVEMLSATPVTAERRTVRKRAVRDGSAQRKRYNRTMEEVCRDRSLPKGTGREEEEEEDDDDDEDGEEEEEDDDDAVISC